jgi:light-harvesting protein B-800-850 alpha chain
MIYGKIWCVVKPSVGVPLFLGSVALTSLAVHYSVLTHTTWFARYWEGKAASMSAAGAEAKPAEAPAKK